MSARPPCSRSACATLGRSSGVISRSRRVLRSDAVQHTRDVWRLVTAWDDHGHAQVDGHRRAALQRLFSVGIADIHRPPNRNTVPAVRSRMRRSNSIDRCFTSLPKSFQASRESGEWPARAGSRHAAGQSRAESRSASGMVTSGFCVRSSSTSAPPGSAGA